MTGPLDPTTGNNTLITASSLYGVRQWNAGNPMDQQFVSRYANVFGENLGGNNVPTSDLEMAPMPRELQQSTGPLNRNNALNPEPNQLNQQNANQTGNQATTPDSNLARPQPAPVDSPNKPPLPGGQLQSSLPTTPLPGGLATGESVARVLTVPPAQQQTQANDTLQKRLEERFGKPAQSDVDAARQYNADLKRAQAKGGNAQPGAGQPAVGATVPPAAQGTTPAPTAVPGTDECPSPADCRHRSRASPKASKPRAWVTSSRRAKT